MRTRTLFLASLALLSLPDSPPLHAQDASRTVPAQAGWAEKWQAAVDEAVNMKPEASDKTGNDLLRGPKMTAALLKASALLKDPKCAIEPPSPASSAAPGPKKCALEGERLAALAQIRTAEVDLYRAYKDVAASVGGMDGTTVTGINTKTMELRRKVDQIKLPIPIESKLYERYKTLATRWGELVVTDLNKLQAFSAEARASRLGSDGSAALGRSGKPGTATGPGGVSGVFAANTSGADAAAMARAAAAMPSAQMPASFRRRGADVPAPPSQPSPKQAARDYTAMLDRLDGAVSGVVASANSLLGDFQDRIRTASSGSGAKSKSSGATKSGKSNDNAQPDMSRALASNPYASLFGKGSNDDDDDPPEKPAKPLGSTHAQDTEKKKKTRKLLSREELEDLRSRGMLSEDDSARLQMLRRQDKEEEDKQKRFEAQTKDYTAATKPRKPKESKEEEQIPPFTQAEALEGQAYFPTSLSLDAQNAASAARKALVQAVGGAVPGATAVIILKNKKGAIVGFSGAPRDISAAVASIQQEVAKLIPGIQAQSVIVVPMQDTLPSGMKPLPSSEAAADNGACAEKRVYHPIRQGQIGLEQIHSWSVVDPQDGVMYPCHHCLRNARIVVSRTGTAKKKQ